MFLPTPVILEQHQEFSKKYLELIISGFVQEVISFLTNPEHFEVFLLVLKKSVKADYLVESITDSPVTLDSLRGKKLVLSFLKTL